MNSRIFGFALVTFANLVAGEVDSAEPVPTKSTVSVTSVTEHADGKTADSDNIKTISIATEYFQDLALDSEIAKKIENQLIVWTPNSKILRCNQYAISYNLKYQQENPYGDKSSKTAVCLVDIDNLKKTALICYNISQGSHAVGVYTRSGASDPNELPIESIASFSGTSCPPAP